MADLKNQEDFGLEKLQAENLIFDENSAPQSNQNIHLENEGAEEREPISIKEMMTGLGGVFPMDEAVVESTPPLDHKDNILFMIMADNFSPSVAQGHSIHLRREIRYERLDGHRSDHGTWA